MYICSKSLREQGKHTFWDYIAHAVAVCSHATIGALGGCLQPRLIVESALRAWLGRCSSRTVAA